MDHLLTDTQRAWQIKAREFAETEIAPRSLARDQIAAPADTFDWELILAFALPPCRANTAATASISPRRR